MPRNSDTFWSRVLFKDFIRHFRKMSPEQIAEDITESMDALEDLNPDGDSFGSLMVRWANERMNGAFATAARENGKKGGRPRKQETTADAPTREAWYVSATDSNISSEKDGSRQSRRTGGSSARGMAKVTQPPVRSLPLPSKEQLYDFAREESLDEGDARDWFEMTVVDRAGKDRNGNRISNWKAACRKFCTARAERRSA